MAKEFSASYFPGMGVLILLDTEHIEKVPRTPAQRMIHRHSSRVTGRWSVYIDTTEGRSNEELPECSTFRLGFLFFSQ
jgi:hypothetical protein